MMGNGKNTIPSPKRLQPLASRPQVRTLGAIIYFDVPNSSGVCFNSFYLSSSPAMQDLKAVGFLRNLANQRSRNDLACKETTSVELSLTHASQMKQGLRPGGEEINFLTTCWDFPQKLHASGPRTPLGRADARYLAPFGIASWLLSRMSRQIFRHSSQTRADFICFEFTMRRTRDSDFPQKEQLFMADIMLLRHLNWPVAL